MAATQGITYVDLPRKKYFRGCERDVGRQAVAVTRIRWEEAEWEEACHGLHRWHGWERI